MLPKILAFHTFICRNRMVMATVIHHLKANVQYFKVNEHMESLSEKFKNDVSSHKSKTNFTDLISYREKMKEWKN